MSQARGAFHGGDLVALHADQGTMRSRQLAMRGSIGAVARVVSNARGTVTQRHFRHLEPIMGTKAIVVFYVVLMAAVIVAVDVLFFRNRFWERLMANIGIVLVFAAFYFRFLKHQ